MTEETMAMDLATLFGLRLRRARHAAGLTALEVAEALGCSQAAVSRWETGGRVPALDVLPAIAHAAAANLAVDYLRETRECVTCGMTVGVTASGVLGKHGTMRAMCPGEPS